MPEATGGTQSPQAPGVGESPGPVSLKDRLSAFEGPERKPNAAAPSAPAKKEDMAAARVAKAPVNDQRQDEARRYKLRFGENDEREIPETEILAKMRRGENVQQQLSRAAAFRQEALKARAEADGILNRLKSDPRGALRDLGVNLSKMSQEEILEEIRLEQMTPQERALHDREKAIRAKEEEHQKAEEKKKGEADHQEMERHKDEFAGLFMDVLERTGLPKASGRHMVRHLADLYEEFGGEIDPDSAAAHVMAKLVPEHRAVMLGLEGEALLEHLGDELVRKVVSGHLSRIKGQRKQTQTAPAPRPVARSTPVAPGKAKDFFRNIQE